MSLVPLTHPQGRTRRLAAVAVAGAIALIGGVPGFASPAARAATAAPAAVSGTSARPYHASQRNTPDPELKGRWGERLASAALPGPRGGAASTGKAGDFDGDGTNDFFVGEPSYSRPAAGTSPALARAGRVYAVSGRSKKILYSIDSPAPQAGVQFGFFISVIGDVDGDGVNDIAIGTDAQTVSANGVNSVGQGAAWVFSGAGGRLLYALNDPDPRDRARFGSRIGRVGDVNGDGVPDIVVGASGTDVCSTAACSQSTTAGVACGSLPTVPAGCRRGQGEAFVFSGKDGSLNRTLTMPDTDQPMGSCSSSCGSFGLAVQGPGEINGTPTILVDAGGYSFDTTTNGGPGAPGGACQGATPTAACNKGQGRMYLFNALTGALMTRIDDPTPQAGATFGFQDAAPLSPGDVNGDGSNDLYANGFLQDGPTGPGEGEAWVFDGKASVAAGPDGHGVVLYSLRSPAPENGGQFGFSMATTDYNSNGHADLYVGASPHHVAGAGGSGVTAVFDGTNGLLLKTLALPAADVQPSTDTNLGPNIGWSNAAPGDLDGDGQPDYLGGAPFLDVGAHQDQGAVFAFQSGQQGYTLASSDGTVLPFGSDKSSGSPTGLNQPIVGAAATPNGDGYWLVASDGGVFSFGDASFYGSTGNLRLSRPIVGIAPTPDGHGYWLVASDGGVFSFGDATFFGSTGNIALSQPMVGMAASPDAGGYWLVARDGGIFAFGDTAFYGSTGNIHLNQPIVGMAHTPAAHGYWLVASDGGIFAFGDAPYLGSLGGVRLAQPIVGMAS